MIFLSNITLLLPNWEIKLTVITLNLYITVQLGFTKLLIRLFSYPSSATSDNWVTLVTAEKIDIFLSLEFAAIICLLALPMLDWCLNCRIIRLWCAVCSKGSSLKVCSAFYRIIVYRKSHLVFKPFRKYSIIAKIKIAFWLITWAFWPLKYLFDQ